MAQDKQIDPQLTSLIISTVNLAAHQSQIYIFRQLQWRNWAERKKVRGKKNGKKRKEKKKKKKKKKKEENCSP